MPLWLNALGMQFHCQQPIGCWPAMGGGKCNRISSTQTAILQRRMNSKKLPEAMAAACLKNENRLPVPLMFQDEARFGRMSDPRSCWAPLSSSGGGPGPDQGVPLRIRRCQPLGRLPRLYDDREDEHGEHDPLSEPGQRGTQERIYCHGCRWSIVSQKQGSCYSRKCWIGKAATIFTRTEPSRTNMERIAPELFCQPCFRIT